MSQQAGLAKRLETADLVEQPVRPKVMRRPVQFSSKTQTSEPKPALTLSVPQEPTPDLAAPSLPVPVIAHRTAWQDDARFGAVMLAVILVTNIALMLWLPRIHPATSPIPVAMVAHEASAPSIQTSSGKSDVTLYSSQHPTIDDDAADVPASVADAQAPAVHVLGENSHVSDLH